MTTFAGTNSTLSRALSGMCFAAAVFGTAPVLAAEQCGARDKLIKVLGQRYQENRQALGLAGHAAVFELYVSDQGTWTLLSTATSGVTCIVAAGEAWQSAPKLLAGRDS